MNERTNTTVSAAGQDPEVDPSALMERNSQTSEGSEECVVGSK